MSSDVCAMATGESKEELPTAMLVRSGDGIVLAGESRRCYHGVPRILEQKAAAFIVSGSQCEPIIAEYLTDRRINISVRSTV